MRKTLLFLSSFLLFGILAFCDKQKAPETVQLPRIEWNTNSLRIISEEGDSAYNGYSRLVQLKDRSLFAVYFNSSKGIIARKSLDYGDSWGDPFLILPNSLSHAMDNPEILQLQDGSLLVSTNLRPFGVEKNQDQTRHFQIGVIMSSDGGKRWSPLKILYTASWQSKDGCWEPKAIQLPSGEIQVYFSNEAPYTNSDEQNISILSSIDGGQNWTTEPVMVSFRNFFRDGMPAPIVLKGSSEIVMAIEDNGTNFPFTIAFKISIIRNQILDGWSKPVDGGSANRKYALNDIFSPSGPDAGAPYLTQLPSGETILSYQSTLDRKKSPNSTNYIDYAIPYVAVGDAQARNFQNASAPFQIPEGKNGLWNSVTALDNGEIIVLTSTNGLSKSGKNEVWMIKGKLK